MNQGIEQSLFKWDDLIEVSPEALAFGNCELVKDMKDLKKGTRFASIWLFWEESKIKLYEKENDNEPKYILDLALNVV